MTDTLTAPSNGFTPGQIPESDERPPPSVWAAGDVHHTHEQVYDESPAGVQAANAPDPRDAEIMRLNAIIAGTSKDPNAPAVDPKDAEIARLKALVNEDPTAPLQIDAPAPVEAQAVTVDPRDDEIAQLRRELEERDADKIDPEAAAAAALTGDAEVTPAG